MNALIQKLIELQTLELRAAELRRQIESFPKRLLEIDQSVKAAQDGLAAARQRVLELHKHRKKLELDVDEWRGKIAKYKDQLYQVKTNEAYRALQAEIRNAEAEMARAEDRLLEEMVGGEDADRQVKEAEAGLKEAEAAAAADRAKVMAEKAAVEKEYGEAEQAVREHLAQLPAELVDHYKRIARRHGGVAVAEVRDEACSMCSVRIRPHVMQLLRQSGENEIFHCETCTRILYYAEKPAAAENRPEASVAEAGN